MFCFKTGALNTTTIQATPEFNVNDQPCMDS
jgi:hypothetical protein